MHNRNLHAFPLTPFEIYPMAAPAPPLTSLLAAFSELSAVPRHPFLPPKARCTGIGHASSFPKPNAAAGSSCGILRRKPGAGAMPASLHPDIPFSPRRRRKSNIILSGVIPKVKTAFLPACPKDEEQQTQATQDTRRRPVVRVHPQSPKGRCASSRPGPAGLRKRSVKNAMFLTDPSKIPVRL